MDTVGDADRAGVFAEMGWSKGVLSNRIIRLNGHAPSKKYPSKMHLVIFKYEATGKVYHFIANHFRLTAATIAEFYGASFPKGAVARSLSSTKLWGSRTGSRIICARYWILKP